MPTPDLSGAKRGSFLQPSEREFLKRRGYHPMALDCDGKEESTIDETSAEWRINNHVASQPNFQNIIESFRDDLMDIARYQLLSGGQSRRDFRINTLRSAKEEMKLLRDKLDTLIDQAETGSEKEINELQELQGTYVKHLYAHIDDDPIDGSDFFNEDISEAELDAKFEKKQEIRDQEEAMRIWLKKMLSQSERLEVLEELYESGKTQLTGQVNGNGEPKATVASKYLMGIDGLPDLVVKDDTFSNHVQYDLTQEGKAIVESYRALREIKFVKQADKLRPEQDTPQTILDLLAVHLSDFRDD